MPTKVLKIGGRLRTVRQKFGKTIPEMLIAMGGVSASSYKYYERDLKVPRREKLDALAKTFPDLNLDWLLTGKGEMLRSDEPPASDDYVYFDRRDVRAAAGGGVLVESEQVLDVYAFKRPWASKRGFNPKNCCLIEVSGDSMAPTLHDGDTILVDLSDHKLTPGEIYVVRHEEGLLVKRIGKSSTPGKVVLVSDNTAFSLVSIPRGDLDGNAIIGRVRWLAREGL